MGAAPEGGRRVGCGHARGNCAWAGLATGKGALECAYASSIMSEVYTLHFWRENEAPAPRKQSATWTSGPKSMASPPALRELCESHLSSVLAGIERVDAQCSLESDELTREKDALLVRLGAISQALEDVHASRAAVRAARTAFVSDVREALPGSDALNRIEAAAAEAAAAAIPETRARHGVPPAKAEAASRRAKRPQRATGESAGGEAPREAGGDEESLSRQVFIGLPRSATVTHSELTSALEVALADAARKILAPSRDAAGTKAGTAGTKAGTAAGTKAGTAVEAVHVYAGGGYAFATLASAELAGAALRLPPMRVGGTLLRIEPPRGDTRGCPRGAPDTRPRGETRPRGGPADAPELPPGCAPVECAPAAGGARTTLESQIYWCLRHAPCPKPKEKEVR